jgi:hypothetical protein
MNWLRRILVGNGWRYIVTVLVILNHVLIGMLAWRGSKFAIVELVIFASLWTVLTFVNTIARNRTVARWEKSLLGWDETQNLAVNYVDLLLEACNALSTWDREKADDIVSRTRTISALRQANLNERMGDND